MKKARSAANRPTLPLLLGGGIALAAALLTRLTVGSPLAVIHKLDAFSVLPPLWILSLVWLAAFAWLGAAAGYLLACPPGSPKREADLWRGCTFAVLGAVFSLVWYTLLFGKFYLLPSWFCLPVSAAAAGICGLSWGRIGKGGAAAALAFGAWQICLFLIQLGVILHT